MTRSDLLSRLNVEYGDHFKLSEDYDGRTGAIWVSAEEVYVEDYPVFNFETLSPDYEVGVMKEMACLLQEMGWYAEFVNPGTVMLYEV